MFKVYSWVFWKASLGFAVPFRIQDTVNVFVLHTGPKVYDIMLRIDDNGVPPLFSLFQLTITILDVNDPPVLTSPNVTSMLARATPFHNRMFILMQLFVCNSDAISFWFFWFF